MTCLNEKQALAYVTGIPESSKFDLDTFGSQEEWRFKYEDPKGRHKYFNDLNVASAWVIHFITREKHSIPHLRLIEAKLRKAVLKGQLLFNGYWTENTRDKIILHCDTRVAPLPCETGVVSAKSAIDLIRSNVNLDGSLNIAEIYFGNGNWSEVETFLGFYESQPTIYKMEENL